MVPRYVGVDYAAANTLDDEPVAITTNYNPDNLPNENNDCEGNLVFGAITEDSTMYVFDEQVTFNAGIRPTCGLGTVLIDATGQGNLGDDGDGIGRDDVEVTVVFALGGVPLPPVSGTFFDNKETSNDCYAEHPVHPTEIPDLPCPPSSAPNNNGQSYVGVAGAARSYAVRAQATAAVNSLFCQLCGVTFGPFSVSAKSTAVYDYAIRRPRLIRIDEFICPGP